MTLATSRSSQTPAERARLIEWILAHWQPGIGRVQETKEYSAERQLFLDLAAQAFRAQGVPVARIRTWFNVQIPDHSPGLYDVGYPHVHADTEAVTLVYYLDPGDDAAPLDVLEGEEVVETIAPEAGKIVFIPNGVWHAVHKNRGERDRIALIATAYPR